MKITYLFNSGFVVELEHHILIFDYWKGALDALDPKKKLYIFSSHSHKDHFNEDIFNIKHPHKTYILSHDIDAPGILLAPHQSYHDDDINVHTLLSTDLGVAFVVEIEGRFIYHSGDLNWWDWEGEPQDFLDNQERIFKQEIDSLKSIHFDLMMIPLDIRLEKNASKAIEYIENHIQVDTIIPMHCFSHHKEMSQLVLQPPLNHYHNILTIEKRHQVFLIP